MKDPVRRAAQIVLSALLMAGLSGCGNKCDKLRDTCNKCTDPLVRGSCLDWARDMDSGGPFTDCAIGLEMFQECR